MIAVVGLEQDDFVARVQRGSDANLLVLEIRLDGHVLSDSFTAYQDGGQVLLPLGELSRLLTLAITVQPTQGTASGFVIREDRTFELAYRPILESGRLAKTIIVITDITVQVHVTTGALSVPPEGES